MHRIAYGTASKLMGDQIFPRQFLIQLLRHLVFYHQRMPGA
ncbi:hypothetical protein NGUA15_03306 [Salmonella enterica]|nr:hypothetical protein NGUA15_03306 [Salmonella enterica]